MMKKITTMVFLLMFTTLLSANAEKVKPTGETFKLPADVEAMLVKAQECAYWIEQWSPELSEKERVQVEEQVNTVCLEVIDERQKLLEKYHDHPEVLEHLN